MSALATGASFTGATLTVMFAVDVDEPSVTVYGKFTGPLKLDAGVKVSVPSAFSVTVPCGSTTGVPTAMDWPATWVIVRVWNSTSVSLRRGSKVTAVSSTALTVSGLVIGVSSTGAT